MKTLGVFLLVICLFGTAFAQTKKKIFVIGDSISIQYGPFLKNFIESKFEYDRKRDNGEAMQDLNKPVGANGGDSKMVVEYLKTLQTDKSFKADILLVNCGLHDIKTDRKTGKKAIELDEYKANLKEIFKIARKLKVKLIWITSTPVNDEIHNSKNVGFYRYSKDAEIYNDAAKALFEKEKVPIIDLNTFSKEFPLEAYSDHVHYKPEYAKIQAAFIAGFLLNAKF